MPESDVTQEFVQFLTGAANGMVGPQNPVELMIGTMRPSSVALLENLSLPHWFNDEIYAACSGDADRNGISSLAGLSFVRTHPRGHSFHESARQFLRERLLHNDPVRFRTMSRRIADVLAGSPEPPNEELSWEKLYLTLAFDEPAGLHTLDLLFTDACDSRRFTACSALLQLASEQKQLLSESGTQRLEFCQALLALNLNDFATAERRFRGLLDKQLPPGLTARVALGLGTVFENTGALNESARLYRIGLSKTEALQADVSWRLHQGLARVALVMGDVKAAEDEAQRARKISIQACDSYGEAMSAQELGEIYARMMDVETARQLFQDSLELFHRAGRDYEKSRAYLSLAALEESIGKWNAAEVWYNLARETKTSIGDDYGIAVVNANVGNLYIRQGKPDAALPYLNSSLENFRRFRDPVKASYVLFSIAMAHERSNRVEPAIKCLNAALAEMGKDNSLQQQCTSELQRLQRGRA